MPVSSYRNDRGYNGNCSDGTAERQRQIEVEGWMDRRHQRELHVTIPAGEFKQPIGVVGFAPKCTASPCAA
jgi:hypothetical protein